MSSVKGQFAGRETLQFRFHVRRYDGSIDVEEFVAESGEDAIKLLPNDIAGWDFATFCDGTYRREVSTNA